MGTSAGSFATRIPAAVSAAIFSSAEPELPEMIAPACPICFPGGADCPAIKSDNRFCHMLLYILCRQFFCIATNLTDHDDSFRILIILEHFQQFTKNTDLPRDHLPYQ